MRRVADALRSVDVVRVAGELWRRVDVLGEVANAAGRLNVVNFAGLFSGTAIAPPPGASVRLRVEF